jgi:hypothetical protein
MTTEVATLEPMHLLATTPEGMVHAQGRMVAWAEARISLARVDVDEARRTFEAARSGGFTNLTQFSARLRREKAKLAFYEKVGAALAAGYYIVPPFPVRVFAIRTDRSHARPGQSSTYSGRSFEQPAPSLAAGKGAWKSPEPEVYIRRLPQGEGKADKTEYYPVHLVDPEFPFVLVKPELIEATKSAMSRMFFDALGVVDGQGADPILLGQIKRPGGRYAPALNFFIAWWLDTKELL